MELLKKWPLLATLFMLTATARSEAVSIELESEIVRLPGPWNFYWQQLVTPQQLDSSQPTASVNLPHTWTGQNLEGVSISRQGYATYAKRFTIDSLHPVMALQIPEVFSSFDVWINGRHYPSPGKVGKTRNDSVPAAKVPPTPFPDQTTTT